MRRHFTELRRLPTFLKRLLTFVKCLLILLKCLLFVVNCLAEWKTCRTFAQTMKRALTYSLSCVCALVLLMGCARDGARVPYQDKQAIGVILYRLFVVVKAFTAIQVNYYRGYITIG